MIDQHKQSMSMQIFAIESLWLKLFVRAHLEDDGNSGWRMISTAPILGDSSPLAVALLFVSCRDAADDPPPATSELLLTVEVDEDGGGVAGGVAGFTSNGGVLGVGTQVEEVMEAAELWVVVLKVASEAGLLLLVAVALDIASEDDLLLLLLGVVVVVEAEVTLEEAELLAIVAVMVVWVVAVLLRPLPEDDGVDEGEV